MKQTPKRHLWIFLGVVLAIILLLFWLFTTMDFAAATGESII